MEERRRFTRFHCPGGVDIYQLHGTRKLWGQLADISRGGIYVETADPWAVDAAVELRIETDGAVIAAIGRVATCHFGVGMGIEFEQVEPACLHSLEDILHALETTANGVEALDLTAH